MKKAIIALMLILVFGCNPTKRLERKQEKSWDIFVTNPTLIKRAVPIVSSLYPCINEVVRSDTNTVYVVDTFKVENKIPYNVYKDKILDTLIDNISIFADSTGIAVKYLGKKEKTVITIKDTVLDKAALNRANDTINVYKVKEGNYVGQITQLQVTIGSMDKKVTYADLKFYGLIALIVAYFGISLYLRFKPKL
jgi:hypothetical protein